VISLVFLAGCSDFYRAVDGHNTVTGSKNIETRQFDYSGFKKIEVSNAFNVEVNRVIYMASALL